MLPQILLALEPLPAEVAHDCELVRVTRHVGLEMVLVSEAALANLVESGIETNDQPSFFFFGNFLQTHVALEGPQVPLPDVGEEVLLLLGAELAPVALERVDPRVLSLGVGLEVEAVAAGEVANVALELQLLPGGNRDTINWETRRKADIGFLNLCF